MFQGTKHGLAPSTSLDKLGFKPASHTVTMVCIDACSPFLLVSLVLQQLQATKNIPTTKIVPPTLVTLPHLFSPSPAASWAPSCTLTTPDPTDTSRMTISNKDNQGSIMGRLPDSVHVILKEGFDKIDVKLSQLAAHARMPFHQVSDCYIRSHSHAHAANLWNVFNVFCQEYSMGALSSAQR